jgi:hypothetical protein
VPTDERIERLLRLAASLEEAIIRLEQQRAERELERAIDRLRVMQGEILGALRQLEGDFRDFD